MSKYSEVAGSFIRMGSYPLEANYIFDSEAALKEFYNLPINKTTLHKGLLKIVANDSEQSLYWVIEKDSELQFEKLIESIDITNLTSQLEELKTRLDEHDKDYENLVSSVEDLQMAIDDLAETVNEDINTLKTLIGITDNQDIIEYLSNLPYDSLTSAYNALQEVKNFLKGYEEGETLKEVELNIKTLIRSLVHNLQTELDLTQIGVGLSGDGSYNSDKETYLLKDATSVMNALKTLDAALYQILDNPGSLLNTDQTNDIIVKDKGLFFSISTEYENGILTVNVNGEPKYTHDLGLSAIVDEAYYDGSTEKIVIIFKLHSGEVQRVEIPADKLITEWDVEETATVSLNRERVVDGADILTANVKISQEAHNSLQEKADGLFSTGGEAINILPNRTIDEFVIDYRGDYGCYCILWRELEKALDKELVAEANSQDALMYMEDSDGSKYLVVESDLNGEIPLENFSFVYKGFLCNGKTKGYPVTGLSVTLIEEVNLSSRDFLLNELSCLPIPEGFDHWGEVPVQLELISTLSGAFSLNLYEYTKSNDTWIYDIKTPYQNTPLDRYVFSYDIASNTLSWVENQYDYEHGSKYYITIDKDELRTDNNQYPVIDNQEISIITGPNATISFPNPKVYINNIPVDDLSVYADGYWSGQISYDDITLVVVTSASEASGKMTITLIVTKAPSYTHTFLIIPELYNFIANWSYDIGFKEFPVNQGIVDPGPYETVFLPVTSASEEEWIQDESDSYPPRDQTCLLTIFLDKTKISLESDITTIKYICDGIGASSNAIVCDIDRIEDSSKYAYLVSYHNDGTTLSGHLMMSVGQYFDKELTKVFFNAYSGEGWVTRNFTGSSAPSFNIIKDPFGYTLQVFETKSEIRDPLNAIIDYYFSYYGPTGLTNCMYTLSPDEDGNFNTEVEIIKLKSPARLEILSQEEYEAVDPKDDNTVYVIPDGATV